MKFKKVCGWCGKTTHEGSEPNAPVTTGICPPCMLKYFGITPEQLKARGRGPVLPGPPPGYKKT